jgi:hypothetical protein
MSQIDWIYKLQQIRHPMLDEFVKMLDFFDRQEFLFILIPLVWLGYGKGSGLRLFYILALNAIAN